MDLGPGASGEHFDLSKFDSAEQMSYFENLSWSPWNTLPQHAPLGGINRARKLVYEDSSTLRHETTGMAYVMPSGRESFDRDKLASQGSGQGGTPAPLISRRAVSRFATF